MSLSKCQQLFGDIYDGDGLRRSALEAGGSLTTFIWDGSDYLMEKTP